MAPLTDGIIKGTGNSRYLKSVSDVLARYPTHESLMQALADGTFPIDLSGINPAGWKTVGTALNKANLLTDALCTALGLATTATPTQAMEKLRTMANTAQSTADGKCRVAAGSYTGTNSYGTTGTGKTLTFSFDPEILFVLSGSNNRLGIFLKPNIGSSIALKNVDNDWGNITSIRLSTTKYGNNTISWSTSTNDPQYSFTYQNYVYNYLAIG